MKSKKEVLEEWFKRVWTEEDKSAIYEMFVPDKTGGARGLNKEEDEDLGPAEFEGFHQLMLALIKDVKITIDSYIEQGDSLCAECTFSSFNRKSNEAKPIIMKGCVIAQIVDGKLIKAGNYFDFLNFFEALELLPENTLEKCLTGNRVY